MDIDFAQLLADVEKEGGETLTNPVKHLRSEYKKYLDYAIWLQEERESTRL